MKLCKLRNVKVMPFDSTWSQTDYMLKNGDMKRNICFNRYCNFSLPRIKYHIFDIDKPGNVGLTIGEDAVVNSDQMRNVFADIESWKP